MLSLDSNSTLFEVYKCDICIVFQLLDVCTLDMSSKRFSSSVLAASALFLVSERSRQDFTDITGELILCIGG